MISDVNFNYQSINNQFSIKYNNYFFHKKQLKGGKDIIINI